MKKIHKVFLELFVLHVIVFYFTWEITKTKISIEIVFLLSCLYLLVFWTMIFSRFVYLIDNFGIFFPLFPVNFKKLNIGEIYQVISKKAKKASIEDERGGEIIVKNFAKYADFVGVNDYFVINSISPLNIDWTVIENKNEQINIYI